MGRYNNRKRSSYLVTEANYNTTEFLLAKEMKISQILMNNPAYGGLSTLEWSKTVMYELRYDYE